MSAAIAVECAAEAGYRSAMHEIVFEVLDAPAPASWWPLASRAGLQDSASFAACTSNDQVLARIRADVAAAQSLGIRGTPLVLLDSTLIQGAPTSEYLRGYLRRAGANLH